MPTHAEKRVLPYTWEQLYGLVAEVEKYPEFLPWCDHARVVQTHDDGMTAEIGMALAGFHKSFTTRNVNQPGRQVQLHLVQGPFQQLDGTWDFHPLIDPSTQQPQRACRIELTLNYRFESVFGRLVGPLFDKIAATLVDALVKRAEQIYT